MIIKCIMLTWVQTIRSFIELKDNRFWGYCMVEGGRELYKLVNSIADLQRGDLIFVIEDDKICIGTITSDNSLNGAIMTLLNNNITHYLGQYKYVDNQRIKRFDFFKIGKHSLLGVLYGV